MDDDMRGALDLVKAQGSGSVSAPRAPVGPAERRPIGPPTGFSPVPGGHYGGYRKKVGGKWVYWYPSKKNAAKAVDDHDQLAVRFSAEGRVHRSGQRHAEAAEKEAAAQAHRDIASGARRFIASKEGAGTADQHLRTDKSEVDLALDLIKGVRTPEDPALQARREELRKSQVADALSLSRAVEVRDSFKIGSVTFSHHPVIGELPPSDDPVRYPFRTGG